MKICVHGLWHLGSVTAACLASVGHNVIGFDYESKLINDFNQGKAPLFEPGLDEMLKNEINEGKISFTNDPVEAVYNIEILCITYDTPVNELDRADVEFVLDKIKNIIQYLKDGTVLLISSQIPIGSVIKLENFVNKYFNNKKILFAYSPENLRLGSSIDVFLNPDRIVIGIRSDSSKIKLKQLFKPITKNIEWMSIESAEMTKHAINAFLATSVVFANELASICEFYGADAKQVERGLKTEKRIGPYAYLSPGGPFAGGTLARDIGFLNDAAKEKSLKVPLLKSISLSNKEHKNWVRRKLIERFTNLKYLPITIWGLTYKPDTSTLRRSLSVELCKWLLNNGAKVRVFDPAVKKIPKSWGEKINSFDSPLDALKNSRVLVIGTEWLEFKECSKRISEFVEKDFFVIDANRFIQNEIISQGLEYISVGDKNNLELNE